mgnify:CR=1 FL=1
MNIRISKKIVDYDFSLKYMEEKISKILSRQEEEEIWLLQHPPLYTAGTSAREEDILDKDKFPIYEVGRGGKYTYHGPGQRIIYLMLNLKKQYKQPDLKKFIFDLEQWIIDCLDEIGIESFRREGRVGI